MKNLRLFICFFSAGILSTSCDSWFDFTSENWEIEPEYISNESLNFGEDTLSKIFYISNNGNHSQISFTIQTDDKWIVPSLLSGKISKNEDEAISISINRTYLSEGENSGALSVIIDNYPWVIPVSAIGVNRIDVSPAYINFGSNDDVAHFKIRSLSGTRDIEILPVSEWLSVSDKKTNLPEYDANISSTEKTISVSCMRGKLEEGEHTSSVDIISGLGAKILSIPISVFIPSQDELTLAIDNFVFTLSKHLYWENSNVILELKVKNHKYLKLFELVGGKSFAVANGARYSIRSTSLVVQPNDEGILRITIENVDKSVLLFDEIVLCFRDLSKEIRYQNVEL